MTKEVIRIPGNFTVFIVLVDTYGYVHLIDNLFFLLNSIFLNLHQRMVVILD